MPAVVNEVVHLLPKQFPDPQVASSTIDKAERAVKPESIALGAFGAIAALAALLIAPAGDGAPAPHGRRRARDPPCPRRPARHDHTRRVGTAGGVRAGGRGAGRGCGHRPFSLAPLGPVRAVNPTPGVFFDWTVLGFGLLILVVTSARSAPCSPTAPSPGPGRRGAGASPAALVPWPPPTPGLPPRPWPGCASPSSPAPDDIVPSAAPSFGALLAVIVTVATVTFGASLNSLVSHPGLYGWNWDYVVSGGGGSGTSPAQPAQRLLTHDPYVASWSAADFDDLRIDGQFVPVIGEPAGAAVQPPLLSGHGLEGSDQVVLGAITLTSPRPRGRHGPGHAAGRAGQDPAGGGDGHHAPHRRPRSPPRDGRGGGAGLRPHPTRRPQPVQRSENGPREHLPESPARREPRRGAAVTQPDNAVAQQQLQLRGLRAEPAATGRDRQLPLARHDTGGPRRRTGGGRGGGARAHPPVLGPAPPA